MEQFSITISNVKKETSKWARNFYKKRKEKAAWGGIWHWFFIDRPIGWFTLKWWVSVVRGTSETQTKLIGKWGVQMVTQKPGDMDLGRWK